MNFSALIEIMPMLGTGLFGVFFVIGVIWASIALMLKLCK